MDKSKCKVAKVFTVKDSRNTYYVQVMPGLCGLGQDYMVMKDRKQLCYTRYRTSKGAIDWLLTYLCRNLDQMEMF